MLKKILAISGKPGLYKLVSQGKNMLIVESLLTGKRTPAYTHEKIRKETARVPRKSIARLRPRPRICNRHQETHIVV